MSNTSIKRILVHISNYTSNRDVKRQILLLPITTYENDLCTIIKDFCNMYGMEATKKVPATIEKNSIIVVEDSKKMNGTTNRLIITTEEIEIPLMKQEIMDIKT